MPKKTIENFVKLFNNGIIFLFIFSIFNDVFLVERVNGSILKMIFIIFIVFNIKNISLMFLRNKNKIIILFTFFIVALMIQTFIQYIVFSDLDIGLFISYIIILSIIFYFFTYCKNFNVIIYFIWISIAFSILLCFISDTEFVRKSGGTLDPNHFSIHVVTFLLLSIYLYKKNNLKLFIAISILLFSIGILFAMSKSSILVLSVILLYFILLRAKTISPPKVIKSFTLLFLIVLIAWNIDFPFQKKIDQFVERQERDTAGARFHSWKAGKLMIEDNFVSGVGFYEFKNNKKKYLNSYVQGAAAGAHNVYIKLLAESGIVVFVLFLIFLFFLFSENYIRIIRSDYIWIHFAAFSYLIIGMTLSLTYEKDLWLIFALVSNVIYSLQAKAVSQGLRKNGQV